MWSDHDQPRRLSDFGDLFRPGEALEPILARPVRNALTEWLTEIWAEKELKAVGIASRHKALFTGAPGVGKTTLAHHLAARLGLDMLAVRPERIIDKWVGSTARNLGALFEAAAPQEGRSPTLLFLDEFDAYAFKRRDAQQGSDDERNAFVNTLLQRIEQHPAFIVAATNFGNHLDPAVWRRFDIQIELALPGPGELRRILARYLAPYGLPRAQLELLAESLDTATPALVRAFCENLKRQLVVGPKVGWDLRKGAVVERIVVSVQPHPDAGKPRLWSLAASDPAIRAMSWPLPKADAVGETAAPGAGDDGGAKIVQLRQGEP